MSSHGQETPKPQLSRISVAGDGAVWGLDKDGTLLANTEDVLPWESRPGLDPASVGAAADGTVYAVDEAGTLYAYREDAWASLGGLPDGQLASVSAGSADVVWGVDTQGRVLSYDPAAATWTAVGSPPDGPAAQVCATLDGGVFCLTRLGTAHARQGAGWVPLPSSEELTVIAAGEAGWVWAVTAEGAPAQYDGQSWQPVPGPGSRLARIAAGADLTVWSLDTSGRAFQFDPARQSWQPIPGPGPLADIALGGLGNAWAIGPASTERIERTERTEQTEAAGSAGRAAFQYTRDASLWSPSGAPGSFAQIAAVDAGTVWALDASGKVVRLTRAAGEWSVSPQPAGPVWLAAGRDGSMWGARADGTVAIFDHASNAWQSVAAPPAPAVRISAGDAGSVTALDKSGAVHQYDGITKTWDTLTRQAPPGGFADIGALGGGVVYAAAVSGDVYLYIAGAWQPCDGKVTEISAGGAFDVWAIDTDGYPLRLVRGSLEGIPEPGPVLPGWDAEDVYNDLRSTHLWIVNQAIWRAGEDGGPVGAWLRKLLQPGRGEIGEPMHDMMCKGIFDADFVAPFNNPVQVAGLFPIQIPSYCSHFYDPTTGHNWFGLSEPTALSWGSSFFGDSVRAFLDGRLDGRSGAGYKLGLALHYMTDVTQPMHAHNYTYLSSFRWGLHTDYEGYIMGYQHNPAFKPEVHEIPHLGGGPEGYIKAAAEFSRPYLDKLLIRGADYAYFSEAYAAPARATAPALLGNAIAATAGFLLAWANQVYRRPAEWEDMGQPAPGVNATLGLGATVYDGRPYLWVAGSDGNLWNRWSTGNSWLWTNHEGLSDATISAGIGASTSVNGPAVFMIDSVGQVLARWWKPDVLQWEWANLGAPPGPDPQITSSAVAATRDSDHGVYVRTAGGALYKNQVPVSRWEYVAPPEGMPVAEVLGAAFLNGQRCVAVTTDDGQAWLFIERNGPDGTWLSIGAPDGLRVTRGLGVDTRLGFALCSDGLVWMYSWDETGGTNWIRFGQPPDDQDVTSGFTLNLAQFPYYKPYVMGLTDEGPLVIGNLLENITWDDRGEPGKTSIVSAAGFVPYQGDFLKPVVGADGHLWA
ncbi:MAG TPA: tectonin domain-containing protein [Streptosporangiaceae bacterium]|nr:tectonin domain-containing protein [Streptosporangiaceae bacterium]